jgi:hypothetical protein
MAMDYFIGWTQANKIALLVGIQNALLTGQVIAVSTGRGNYTKFDPKVDNSLMYQRLTDSIANSKDFDPTDAIQLACRENRRQLSTRVAFNIERR